MFLRFHQTPLRITLIALVLLIAAPLRGLAADAPPLLVRSVALLDADGTALYSVLLASGSEPLGKLTINASVPASAELVEVVTAPPGATSKAEPRTVSWEIEKIDKDTILGPFTYRVRLTKPDAAVPLSAAASVNWTQPTAGKVDATLSAGTLDKFAEVGKITVDVNG